jgi:putative acetyltransferase
MTSRTTAMPWLPNVHTPEEDSWWVENKLFAETEIHIAIADDAIIGVCAIGGDMVEQLYVATAFQRMGIGKALIDLAKRERPGGLRLYCFADNHNGASFYRSQGFTVAEEGDGSGNEEGMPDLLLAWQLPSS